MSIIKIRMLLLMTVFVTAPSVLIWLPKGVTRIIADKNNMDNVDRLLIKDSVIQFHDIRDSRDRFLYPI